MKKKKKRWHNPPQTNFLLTEKKKKGGGIFSLFERLFIFYILKLVSSRTNIRNRFQKYIEIIGWARSTSATLRS
jgi:hypothetical protein